MPFELFSRAPLPQSKHVREALGIENINNYVYCKAPSFRDALFVGGLKSSNLPTSETTALWEFLTFEISYINTLSS